MNRRKLLNYLLTTGDYCFNVDNFLVPKRIISERGYPINLEDNRRRNLNQGSRWSPEFHKTLKKRYKKMIYTREFPLIIQDQDVWRGLCNKYCVSEIEYRRKNYFVADYFFPRHSMLVEIDSDYHNDVYDQARDEYVQITYGIRTLRFYKFGESKIKNKQYLREFNSWLAERKGLVTSLDYTTMIIEKFYKDNEDILDLLELIDLLVRRKSIKYNTYTLNPVIIQGMSEHSIYKLQYIVFNMYGVKVMLP